MDNLFIKHNNSNGFRMKKIHYISKWMNIQIEVESQFFAQLWIKNKISKSRSLNTHYGHSRGTYIMKLDYAFNIGPPIYIYQRILNHNDFIYIVVPCEYRGALIWIMFHGSCKTYHHYFKCVKILLCGASCHCQNCIYIIAKI